MYFCWAQNENWSIFFFFIMVIFCVSFQFFSICAAEVSSVFSIYPHLLTGQWQTWSWAAAIHFPHLWTGGTKTDFICKLLCKCCSVAQVVSDSLQPHGLQPARLLCPWDFPGKNTGVNCHFLLHGIFLTQGSNHVSCRSCIGRWILIAEPPGKSQVIVYVCSNLVSGYLNGRITSLCLT